MPEPTEEIVRRAIAHLEYAAPLIPQVSGFGTPNREHLDLQIQILEKRHSLFDMDDVAEEFGLDEDADREEYDAAQAAWDWLEGEFNTEDGDFPATWDTFLEEKWTP